MCSSGEATGSVVSPRTATDSARTTKVINDWLTACSSWRASTREVLPVARVLVAGARQGTTSAGSVLRTSLRRSQPGFGRAASSWPPRTCPYRPLITKKSSRAVRGTHFFAKNEVQLFRKKLHLIFAKKCYFLLLVALNRCCFIPKNDPPAVV